jgi:hypothetical protein
VHIQTGADLAQERVAESLQMIEVSLKMFPRDAIPGDGVLFVVVALRFEVSASF